MYESLLYDFFVRVIIALGIGFICGFVWGEAMSIIGKYKESKKEK